MHEVMVAYHSINIQQELPLDLAGHIVLNLALLCLHYVRVETSTSATIQLNLTTYQTKLAMARFA